MKLAGNTILITGGGSGIGLGLTERFTQEGNTVIICGRREEVLQEAQQKFPSIITRVCDVAKEEERISLFTWLANEHPGLNVLINNAGIQNWMSIEDDDFYEKAKAEIEINVTAPVHLIKLFLKLPKADTVINVTSGLAFTPFAKVPVYCGTKAFLRSFTMTLRYSLKDKNIEVIEMIPPALNTDLGGTGIHSNLPSVADFTEAVFAQLQEGKTELTFGTSKDRVDANNAAIGEYFKKLNP